MRYFAHFLQGTGLSIEVLRQVANQPCLYKGRAHYCPLWTICNGAFSNQEILQQVADQPMSVLGMCPLLRSAESVPDHLFDALQQLLLAVRAVDGLSGQDDVIASQEILSLKQLWQRSPITCRRNVVTSYGLVQMLPDGIVRSH